MKAVNIRTITELKTRAKALVNEIVGSGQSVVITQNGKPRVVVMDAVEHDRIQDTLTMLRLLAQSQNAFARTGKASSTAEVRRRVKLAFGKMRRRQLALRGWGRSSTNLEP